jgi:hypothetical protein
MAATVEICESNGKAEVVSHNIANSNVGNIDTSGLNVAVYPIAPGHNTFEKWQRIHVTDMGGSSKIDNLKVWRTGALGSKASHKTNAREAAYEGAQPFDLVSGPSADDRSAIYKYTEAMPAAEPTTANLGIGGTLAGGFNSPGYSDYLIHQIQTLAGVVGEAAIMNYQYDETP